MGLLRGIRLEPLLEQPGEEVFVEIDGVPDAVADVGEHSVIDGMTRLT